MTANYEYSRSNRENLPLPIQMQLSGKPTTFLSIFCCIFGIYINFEHFETKKNDPHSLSISEVNDSEKRASLKVH